MKKKTPMKRENAPSAPVKRGSGEAAMLDIARKLKRALKCGELP
jgi:hypothetical protein